MRVGGSFREARSARGREMNAKMAVTRRSTGRRRAIDRSTQKGRARKKARVCLSSLAGEFLGEGRTREI